MTSLALKLNTLIDPLRRFSNHFLSPLFDLGVRLFMANIFFRSGWSKFENYLNEDWESTVFLFEEVHPLPVLPPSCAAFLGTSAELILPVLLAFGLFGRFGAAGLLIMTAAIQFAVPAEYGVQNADHYFWMFLLGMIFLKGPGSLSLDHLIQKWLK